MPTITVKELVDTVRVMSGLRNNKFYSDDEIAQLIDDAAKQLYDKFVVSNQHYFIKMFDFTLADGESRVLLPTDFMKENLVVKDPGPQEIYIDAVENYQNTAMQGQAGIVLAGPRWFIAGDYLNLYPSQGCAGDYQLRYTPTQEDLALGQVVSLAVTSDYVVRLRTTEPLDLVGTWTQDDANTIHMDTFTPLPGFPPSYLVIDGTQLTVGDRIFIQDYDAPLDPLNMGIWEYTGLGGSGDVLEYTFARITGLEDGDTLLLSKVIEVTDGELYAGTYWSTLFSVAIGFNYCDALAVNRIENNGPTASNVILRNGDFDLTDRGGYIAIEGAQHESNNGTFLINAAGTSAGTLGVVDTLVPRMTAEDLKKTVQISVVKPGARNTVPTILLPWVLYLKVHASIAIRTGRSQDIKELELKLEQQEKRISAMASNRTERVVQAPITRTRYPWTRGGGFGNTF